ncbi:Stp1/IreP family PP2C-type Ser/Thr phosphatase [Thermoactinomyces sp. DSM 45892]|uniref:Stp1/IreP family PP2C-type Ser/Thr phosphatase n=1 Tax=Thermoactinomyces sp. DSM 45892 TaxID=1882753 RepID=UPI0008953EB2|nr:Stp1/IreP family PP2C-type Ser/Thr phosphatase [Thermoactinomyces sp. DSM 45892]SDY57408.1 protein phosphatase [Thermoactinomyces sp. DSM 45892]
MEIAHRTNVGLVRDLNEDSAALVRREDGSVLAIVADGMGGHQAGEIASQTTVKVIESILQSKNFHSTEERTNSILSAVGKANAEVFYLSQNNEQYQGMGTTVIAGIMDSCEVVLGHVGDSRAYMLHKGGLYQLTEDHTYVNLLQKYGQITTEEAKNHPQRNMVVRAIGTAEDVEVDLIHTPWNPDDMLLLCSDGLTDMVAEREIGLVLSSEITIEEKADELIQQAIQAGGKDNISVILLKNTEIL